MSTVHEYRRENLRRLIEASGGVSILGKRLGYTNGSFLVQMAGPAPIREVSESTARKFETTLGLEPGYFDVPCDVPDGQQPAAVMRRSKVAGPVVVAPVENAPEVDLTKLIMLVGTKAEEMGVALGTAKFADVVALALADSREHGGDVREDYIATMLRLAK